MFKMTPRDIVKYLDKYIIGQTNAKKSIAIALRNRWRKSNIKNKMIKDEIIPKNILIIGPTGVGKTEIAKRLSKLTNFPFIKVEATKFTEVGYIGKEVDSIIKDLIETTIKIVRIKHLKKNKLKIKRKVEEKILNTILNSEKKIISEENDNKIYENLKKELLNGLLEEKEIEIDFNSSSVFGLEIVSIPGIEDINNHIQSIFKKISKNKNKITKIKIKDARKILIEEESNKNLNFEDIKKESIKLVEENGIVFIDEIDKICRRKNELYGGIDVSREGVQRDLLPLIDGCSVSTKYGLIKTNNILFIASGAFYNVETSDLLPELQGRLPIKVELNQLTKEDFENILIKTNKSIVSQYISLISTEGISIKFTECAIKEIAYFSWKINQNYENIGARRLYSIFEKIIEDISFNFDKLNNNILINKEYVNKQLLNYIKKIDINKYIL